MHSRDLNNDIWGGVEKSGKTGQGKRSLISTFACFLTATASVISGRGTGRWAMSPLKFKIFLIFPCFLRS